MFIAIVAVLTGHSSKAKGKFSVRICMIYRGRPFRWVEVRTPPPSCGQLCARLSASICACAMTSLPIPGRCLNTQTTQRYRNA